jgi:hypothetical protein
MSSMITICMLCWEWRELEALRFYDDADHTLDIGTYTYHNGIP